MAQMGKVQTWDQERQEWLAQVTYHININDGIFQVISHPSAPGAVTLWVDCGDESTVIDLTPEQAVSIAQALQKAAAAGKEGG